MTKPLVMQTNTGNGFVDEKENGVTNPAYWPSKEEQYPEMDNHLDPKIVLEDDDEQPDPWALINPTTNDKKWSEMDCKERILHAIWLLTRIIILLGLLYLFICSLDFLSTAFKLLGGKSAGQVFSQNELLSNPVCGLMLGVLGTVLLQSSSTTTSIIVTMVAERLLTVQTAIPIVMGANIGTSVTNTIVALGQVVDRNEFRRAFGGATVHDVFNWLTVLCLLPIEAIVAGIMGENGGGPLFLLSREIVKHINTGNKNAKRELLKVITKPFTKLVISIDKSVVEDISLGKITADEAIMVKHCHEKVNITVNATYTFEADIIKACEWGKSGHLFGLTDWTDTVIGIIVLVIALVLLCVCLVLIVKLLHSLLRGHLAVVIKKVVNADFPGKLAFLTGYLAIAVGAGLTILVQSSSIFTSAITPLVGIGVLGIERMYPLTLGANIGTTFTAILASLAQSDEQLKLAMQVALCHLLFNIVGIMIWYPIPFMRNVPIKVAKFLGNKTAKYRWFAIVYLILMFFLFPLFVFAISIPGWQVLLGVGLPILVFFIVIGIINCLQSRRPEALPKKLQTWNWLPKPLHSLEPYDRVFFCCKRCKRMDADSDDKKCPDANKTDMNGYHGDDSHTNQAYTEHTHL